MKIVVECTEKELTELMRRIQQAPNVTDISKQLVKDCQKAIELHQSHTE